MEIVTLALAEYANVSSDGKLNIMGIFDELTATAFPYVHPSLFVVFTVASGPEDSVREFIASVRLVGPSGDQILEIGGQAHLSPARPGRARVMANQIVGLVGVRFPESGPYEFRILVDGVQRDTLHLYAAAASQESIGGG